MGIHDVEYYTIVSVVREIPPNVLTTVTSAGRDAKERISIPGSIARQSLASVVNRAIADFGIWPETIKRMWNSTTMPDSPIRPRKRIGGMSIEFLCHDRLHS